MARSCAAAEVHCFAFCIHIVDRSNQHKRTKDKAVPSGNVYSDENVHCSHLRMFSTREKSRTQNFGLIQMKYVGFNLNGLNSTTLVLVLFTSVLRHNHGLSLHQGQNLIWVLNHRLSLILILSQTLSQIQALSQKNPSNQSQSDSCSHQSE